MTCTIRHGQIMNPEKEDAFCIRFMILLRIEFFFREYDVTGFLKKGKNKIRVLLGNGWYNQREKNVEGDLWYGDLKLCFSLKLFCKNGAEREIISDKTMRWKQSIIVFNNIYKGECHDFRLKGRTQTYPCRECEPPNGELCMQTCPPDQKIRVIKPRVLYTDGKKACWTLVRISRAM